MCLHMRTEISHGAVRSFTPSEFAVMSFGIGLVRWSVVAE